MKFKQLNDNETFVFPAPQLDFDINKVYLKISPRKYQHVGFTNEKGRNVKPITFKIGTVNCEVHKHN